jgi:catechol 2,3-dioxygenase-like lactoylglutathione lyase family enzyme
MRICLTSVFIDDQEGAERFYTEVLGLLVKDNVPYTNTERWLTVVSPEEPDGVELVLHLADEPARAFRQANREIGRPVLSLCTDDCLREADRLKGWAWCSSKNRRGWTTAASTPCLTTAAAT